MFLDPKDKKKKVRQFKELKDKINKKIDAQFYLDSITLYLRLKSLSDELTKFGNVSDILFFQNEVKEIEEKLSKVNAQHSLITAVDPSRIFPAAVLFMLVIIGAFFIRNGSLTGYVALNEQGGQSNDLSLGVSIIIIVTTVFLLLSIFWVYGYPHKRVFVPTNTNASSLKIHQRIRSANFLNEFRKAHFKKVREARIKNVTKRLLKMQEIAEEEKRRREIKRDNLRQLVRLKRWEKLKELERLKEARDRERLGRFNNSELPAIPKPGYLKIKR